MDVATIDNEYAQLEQETQSTAQAIQTLAEKLQGPAQANNPDAKEWLADLKAIADQVQQEQQQTHSLLQALHGFTANSLQQSSAPQQGAGFAPGGPGGLLGGFMGGGFGRAMQMGAGFSVGNMLLNSIFRNI